MITNGYKLREMLRAAQLTLDVFISEFEGSKVAFEGDNKRPLTVISEDIKKQEYLVAKLQEVQQQYNQEVTVSVQGTPMSLAMAVKLQGGAGRQSKMWRSLAGEKKKDRWAAREETARNNDTTYAKETYTKKDALAKANEFSVYAGAIRAAVATGNNTEKTFDVLDRLEVPAI